MTEHDRPLLKINKSPDMLPSDIRYHYTMEACTKEFLEKHGKCNVSVLALVEDEQLRELQLFDMEARDLEFIMDWIQDLDVEQILHLELSHPNSYYTPREQYEDFE